MSRQPHIYAAVSPASAAPGATDAIAASTDAPAFIASAILGRISSSRREGDRPDSHIDIALCPTPTAFATRPTLPCLALRICRISSRSKVLSFALLSSVIVH